MTVVDISAGVFPPRAYLGFGLDMTQCQPADITAVTQAIRKAHRVLSLDKDGTSETFPCGVTWTVPNNVDVSDDISVGESSYSSFQDGSKAASTLEADASLSAKYMAVEGEISAGYSMSKMFQKSYSYALFSYNQTLLNVSLDGWSDYIDEPYLMGRLPQDPWDPAQPKVVTAYKELFSSIGSHLVTGCSYGGRLQLTAWASNAESSVSSNFSADVSVAYNGLNTSGKFNASIKGSDEYSDFSKSIQKNCSCQGGDPAIAGKISSSPEDTDVYTNFEAWVNTSRASPGVMSFQLETLWAVISNASDPKITAKVNDVKSAYDWIVSNPAPHKTSCTFEINSDWGEIGILTPSAFIKVDSVTPTDGVIASTTKINWEQGRSHNQQRMIINFDIVNDGSPIDIMLSHGSDGSKGGNGECTLLMEGVNYKNAGVKDNNWNSQWFFGCEVNPNEIPAIER